MYHRAALVANRCQSLRLIRGSHTNTKVAGTVDIKWSKVRPNMNLTRTYYDLFELDLDFTDEDLKRARLRLLHVYHPDKKGSEKDYHIVERGFEVLSDPKERERYNQNIMLHSPGAEPPKEMDSI